MSILKKKKINKEESVPQENKKSGEVMHYTDIAIMPHESEKANRMIGMHQYTFIVPLKATKNMIREAVQKKYNVKVLKITTKRKSGKQTYFRNAKGMQEKKKYATAILKDGAVIENI